MPGLKTWRLNRRLLKEFTHKKDERLNQGSSRGNGGDRASLRTSVFKKREIEDLVTR